MLNYSTPTESLARSNPAAEGNKINPIVQTKIKIEEQISSIFQSILTLDSIFLFTEDWTVLSPRLNIILSHASFVVFRSFFGNHCQIEFSSIVELAPHSPEIRLNAERRKSSKDNLFLLKVLRLLWCGP